GRGARKTRRDHSFPSWRSLREARPRRSSRRGMGEIVGGMAALSPRGPGSRQGRGTRKEALAIEASRGAELNDQRRQAIAQRMPEVRIPAFAKINLRLDILGKRDDGCHELRTSFHTSPQHDEWRVRAVRPL